MRKYISDWFKDFGLVFMHELKSIFTDGGVMIIFFVAGFGYPLLYNLVYSNGVLEDTPVAVVDNADCAESREFIREVDATREVEIAYRCESMEAAKHLLAERKVNGIIFFPSDFGAQSVAKHTATLSIYADMSSFLYYKNLLMATNFVMLHNIERGQIKPILYEENLPYNRTFSYSIFLLSAVFLLIVQQVMFYGMSMLAGTAREEHRSFATLPDHLHAHGIGRVVFSRGAVYWLLFMIIGVYVACIVPALFGLPQRGRFEDIFVLLMFFVLDCVFFSMVWSTMITRRETVFVLLLFMSPICLFLTGFSWPTTSIPRIWQLFSYLFPTTFGCKAFINMNSAGASLQTVAPLMRSITIQTCIYFVLACVAVFLENQVIGIKKQRELSR